MKIEEAAQCECGGKMVLVGHFMEHAGWFRASSLKKLYQCKNCGKIDIWEETIGGHEGPII